MVKREAQAMDNQRLQTILDISRQMAENRDLIPLLNYAMNIALHVFNAERGFLILLAEDGSLDFRVRRDNQGNDLEHPDEEISYTILSRVIENRKNLLLADAMNTSALSESSSIQALQIRSVACVPMISHNRVIGALYLENRSATHVFGESDLEPLRLFASQAATSIENAMLNQDLETRVQTRTHELATANTQLEIMNQQLDAFAHMAAHDLSNPLQVIMGHATLLAGDPRIIQDEDLTASVKIIERVSYKMSEIIQALLLLASTHEEVIRQPLDMGSLVRNALEHTSALVKHHHPELVIPDQWPNVLGYGPWVEAVWRNYLSNALKYGGNPPRIELGFTEEEDHFRFWVADNGCGISPEHQERIFVPFVRLKHDGIAGHGLGLAIVKRVIEELGGQVGVESEPDQGSIFSFTLPHADGR
jgi:signal transduction histidine kinase